jgi:hypothetical protein
MTQKNLETLAEYVNDMLAVERDLHSALRRHKDDRAIQACPPAGPVLQQIEDVTDLHLKELERSLTSLGESASAVKQAAGSVKGTLAAMYDKLRDDRASRMLRDDYAALCFACICYEMLHTVALAVDQDEIARVAIRHLRDYAPAVMDLGQVVPHVVVQELMKEGKITAADPSVADEAAENSREAWREGGQAASATL